LLNNGIKKTLKMKQTINFAIALLTLSVAFVACSKKNGVTPAPAVSSSGFYSGNILGSPNTIVGPGNAILLRADGTMREYANDYYSMGTSMTARDTAAAKIKRDGTYKTVVQSSVTTITATWIQPNGSPVLTYTLTGNINGHAMTGTFSSAGNGISIYAI
jgi:hypothetical protein